MIVPHTKTGSRVQVNRWALRLIIGARVGHLATATKTGEPHVVPICFTYDHLTIFSSIDRKPKKTEATMLRRMLNISKNAKVCLVFDRYDEDWRKLAYVIIHGRAKILVNGKEHQHAVRLLKRKYHQYKAMKLDDRPVIKIMPTRMVAWKYADRQISG